MSDPWSLSSPRGVLRLYEGELGFRTDVFEVAFFSKK